MCQVVIISLIKCFRLAVDHTVGNMGTEMAKFSEYFKLIELVVDGTSNVIHISHTKKDSMFLLHLFVLYLSSTVLV